MNLSIAYQNRISGERRDNVEAAIACHKAALKVYTRKAYPEEWAMTQVCLGIAYMDRISVERRDNVDAAIACYKAALEVYTREAYPEEWAKTQMQIDAARTAPAATGATAM